MGEVARLLEIGAPEPCRSGFVRPRSTPPHYAQIDAQQTAELSGA